MPGPCGGGYLKGRQTKAELTRINRELKGLRKQLAALEERKAKLMATLEKQRSSS